VLEEEEQAEAETPVFTTLIVQADLAVIQAEVPALAAREALREAALSEQAVPEEQAEEEAEEEEQPQEADSIILFPQLLSLLAADPIPLLRGQRQRLPD
jgi:hypothetical protein